MNHKHIYTTRGSLNLLSTQALTAKHPRMASSMQDGELYATKNIFNRLVDMAKELALEHGVNQVIDIYGVWTYLIKNNKINLKKRQQMKAKIWFNFQFFVYTNQVLLLYNELIRKLLGINFYLLLI